MMEMTVMPKPFVASGGGLAFTVRSVSKLGPMLRLKKFRSKKLSLCNQGDQMTLRQNRPRVGLLKPIICQKKHNFYRGKK
jgi:hypothetical protein